MSNPTTSPSHQILARLRAPDATPDQFTWPELQEVYADHVCLTGPSRIFYYLIFVATFAGVALLDLLMHLSLGGVFLAFCILLFLLSGSVHWLLCYSFHLLPKDTAFARVHHWAIANPPAAGSSANSASITTRLVAPLLIVATLLTAALTLPDKSKHETELRQAITTAIGSTNPQSGGEVLGKAAAWLLHAAFKDDPHASYIDSLGLEYHKYFVVSVVKDKDQQIISIGAFNQVYVRDLSAQRH